MQLTVLVDNSTYTDRYFLAEPALAMFLEDENLRLLFDCGYSDAFLHNAGRMGLDLLQLDYLVFSHGHLDHTWGVEALLRAYTGATLEDRPCRRPTVVAHPQAFTSILLEGLADIGSFVSREKLAHHFELNLSAAPRRLSERLTFLGEIPRCNDFEGRHTIGRKEQALEDDLVPDDTALAWRTDRGLVIVTGCSHAGICNIVEHARAVTGEQRVTDIIGGLHLLNAPGRQLQGTVDYLRSLDLEHLYPCHCTDLAAKIALAAQLPVVEVGVGLKLTFA
jgi:7,8-dihydropterin-6-yl-methyl-4-(beta-D-ribofuranosyl)aminobenzene 5'-phosphate synthase